MSRTQAFFQKFFAGGRLHYLAAVLRGTIKPPGDLTSLDTNVVVMQILDAARESARTGRTIQLKALPH
jgi:predicted dehydrogenase